MSKAPDQSLYDHIMKKQSIIGRPFYAFNPPDTAPYPFVQVGSVQVIPRSTKSHLIGTLFAMIDVWGDRSSRMLVSDIANQLFESLGADRSTSDGYLIQLEQDGSSIEMMIDNSTSHDLWRARMSLQFKLM